MINFFLWNLAQVTCLVRPGLQILQVVLKLKMIKILTLTVPLHIREIFFLKWSLSNYQDCEDWLAGLVMIVRTNIIHLVAAAPRPPATRTRTWAA